MSTSPMRDNPVVPSSIYDKVDKLNTDLNAGFAANHTDLVDIETAINAFASQSHSDMTELYNKIDEFYEVNIQHLLTIESILNPMANTLIHIKDNTA